MTNDDTTAKPGRVAQWETLSFRDDDLRIVHVINGQQRNEYLTTNSVYDTVKKNAQKKYPDFAPGKICSFYRFEDGSIEIKTQDMNEL